MKLIGLAARGRVFAALGLIGIILFAGCSGRPRNVARKVTGKVTLGGEPLAKAIVTFVPVEKGSPSYGVTDETGSYNLVWGSSRNRTIEGAQIGEHLVQISTKAEEDKDADTPIVGRPEKVPLKYRQEGGQPKVTVKRGSNTLDIALEPGPVEPLTPKAKGTKRGAKVEPGC
jgi:hypothetical protein